MRRIERIYIHCSNSVWGNENTVNHWHRLRRFLTMVDGYHISTGYHLVILNGRPYSDGKVYPFLDGSIETARSFDVQGAGVKGDNVNSLHYCLIGKPGKFTRNQLITLFKVLTWNTTQGLGAGQIYGHYEYWTNRGREPMKTCPGIDMDRFREFFREYLQGMGMPRYIPRPKIDIEMSRRRRLLDIVNGFFINEGR